MKHARRSRAGARVLGLRLARKAARHAVGLAAFAAPLLWTATSDAAGMYWSDRGIRPLGRGGAFVAGADDLGAIAYNPAGLADAGSSLLLDAALVNVRTEFT